MKILNLYACLGGNRYLWGDEHEITAVELDPELARMYKERFPNDEVIVADAHQYLLDHYREFDFIWTSPPCPSHSRLRLTNTGEGARKAPASYPDMKLWQEIIFLKHFFDGKYCVENVIPYYEPFIEAQKRGRHLYWTNFSLPTDLGEKVPKSDWSSIGLKRLQEYHKIDISKYNGNQRKDKLVNNLVDYVAGKSILDAALGVISNETDTQKTLF